MLTGYTYAFLFELEYVTSILIIFLSFPHCPSVLPPLPPDAAEESKAEEVAPADTAAADATESKDE